MNKHEWERMDNFFFTRNSRIPRGSLGEPESPPSRMLVCVFTVAIAALVAIAIWPLARYAWSFL